MRNPRKVTKDIKGIKQKNKSKLDSQDGIYRTGHCMFPPRVQRYVTVSEKEVQERACVHKHDSGRGLGVVGRINCPWHPGRAIHCPGWRMKDGGGVKGCCRGVN